MGEDLTPFRDAVLVDLLDRLLSRGVVLGAGGTPAITDVDLVELWLHLLSAPAGT